MATRRSAGMRNFAPQCGHITQGRALRALHWRFLTSGTAEKIMEHEGASANTLIPRRRCQKTGGAPRRLVTSVAAGAHSLPQAGGLSPALAVPASQRCGSGVCRAAGVGFAVLLSLAAFLHQAGRSVLDAPPPI